MKSDAARFRIWPDEQLKDPLEATGVDTISVSATRFIHIVIRYGVKMRRLSTNLFRFAACCFGLLAVPWELSAQDRITGKEFATRSEVIAQHGMAATSQPLATQIALDVLKKGGSAVDAAIAANAALGLMEPTGNGIGGDLFAIVWVQDEKKLYGLNASGRSPASLTLEKLKQELGDRDSIPSLGPLPVSVPVASMDGLSCTRNLGDCQ